MAYSLLILAIAFYLVAWRLQNQIDSRLILNHREKLKFLNFRGGERLKGLHKNSSVLFSVEWNGQIVSYQKLLRDKKFIQTLSDPVIEKYCKWLRVLRPLSIALFIFSSWLMIKSLD